MTASVSLFELFWIFFYVGLFTIGGGLVAITLMQQTIVARGLISPEMFYNMVAISESTPGPIGVNMATYIGYQMYGVGGGIITTLGQVMPSIIVILIIARFMTKYQDKPIIQAVFRGLRPATTGMILVALAQVFVIALLHVDAFKSSRQILDLFNWQALFFYGMALLILFKTKVHPIIVVALGAVFGVLFC